MARILVHIGTHKTATTTIQNSFYRNAELLALHGVVYPRIGTSPGHHGLSGDWYRDLPPVLHYAEGSREMWRRIAREHSEGDHTVFLSSETLSVGHPNGAPNYKEIREILAPFDEVRIVCTLREQWQFMQSVFLEIAKKTVPTMPGLLARKALAGEYCAGMWTDYPRFYDRLLGAFSADEIRFLDYDQARAEPGGILGVMLREAGSDLTSDQLDLGGAQANPSLPALSTWAALVLSQPAAAPNWLIDTAEGVFTKQFGDAVRPCLFTREEFENLRTHFDAINVELTERLAQTQPGFTISRTPDEALRKMIFRNRINAPFWTQVARELARQRMLG